jgi:hypothetical protein
MGPRVLTSLMPALLSSSKTFLSPLQTKFATLGYTLTDDSRGTPTQDLNNKFGLLIRILGNKSKLTSLNELTIYKTILRLSWLYAVEVWGSAKAFNLARIQRFQSKVLHHILVTSWIVSNYTIHLLFEKR